MQCPTCQTAMTLGLVETRTGTAVRIMTGDHGMGSRIVFEAEASGDASDLGMSCKAYRCDECHTVVVPGAGLDALQCFECQAAIPTDAEACPQCGWTW